MRVQCAGPYFDLAVVVLPCPLEPREAAGFLCVQAYLKPELHLCVLADVNSRSARVLFLLVVPGHLVFLYTISSMQGGHTTLTLIFIVFYMTAALLQVSWSPSRGCNPSGWNKGTLPCHLQRGPVQPVKL